MNSRRPKVSVITITYNQEKFIEQTLNSILQQKFDSPFELIVSDDASTDKTAAIVRRYAQKYPDTIKARLREKNVGPSNNFFDALLEAKGDYIALCEGDDYWTDESKLQTQVDFLERNEAFSLCFHPVKVVYEDSSEPESQFPDRTTDFTVKELLKVNFIQTNSVLYRRRNYSGIVRQIMPVDWYLHLFHAQYGQIGFIDRTMSVYRRHSGGLWWNTTKNKNLDKVWKRHGIGHIMLYQELLRLYGKTTEYREIIDDHLSGTFDVINRLAVIEGDKQVQAEAEKLLGPNYQLLLSLQRANAKLQKSMRELADKHSIQESNLKELRETISLLEQEKASLEQALNKTEAEKAMILGSRTYKAGLLLTAPVRITRKIIGKMNNE